MVTPGDPQMKYELKDKLGSGYLIAFDMYLFSKMFDSIFK